MTMMMMMMMMMMLMMITCWSSCATPGAPSRQLIPLPTRCQLELTVQRMVRNESLVTADVSWTTGPSTASNGCSGSLAGMPISASQCLVTWEVSGGGLMGNLLTESTSVQLSLWPDTSYRVQVTCRSKHSSALVRSAPLLIGTSGAIVLEARKSTTTTTTTTPLQILLAEIAEGDDDEALARALDSSEEAQDTDRKRQRTPAQSSTTAKLHPWPIARESESEIAILALFVAMLLFLLVLLTIVILVRWQPGPGEPERLEKDALVANEVMVEILHV
uniref:Fibronectin type-III domain-containing protein n=1 Tax=Anopheles dirus TaxID=7168 RepID=A0A182MZL7_9DIPT